MWKFVKCCLKTKNSFLKTETKHPLRLQIDLDNKTSSPRWMSGSYGSFTQDESVSILA